MRTDRGALRWKSSSSSENGQDEELGRAELRLTFAMRTWFTIQLYLRRRRRLDMRLRVNRSGIGCECGWQTR